MSSSYKISDEIKSLRNVSFGEKNNILITLDGSLYGSNIWSYVGEIEQRNIKKSQATIQWNIDLENGSCFTDIKYLRLLEASKDFIYSLRLVQTRRGRVAKVTTILKAFKSLKPLLRWMVKEEILEFSLLTPEIVLKYLSHLRTLNSKFGTSLSHGEIFKRLDVIDQVWRQSGFISHGLVANPFPDESPFYYSGITKEKQKEQKFDFIPDDIAIALCNNAVNYVLQKSEIILEASKAVDLAYSKAIRELSKAAAERHARLSANKFGYKFVKDVTKDVGHLRTACYIVIAFFSGIRDSELASLDIDCVEEDLEGGYTWVHGYIYKTAEHKKKSRWMVPPIVKVAVNVVQELTFNIRQELLDIIEVMNSESNAPLTSGRKKNSLEKNLIDLQRVKSSLWLVKSSKLGNTISSNKTIHQQLLAFINSHDIPYHDGKPWNLHPHQFRRTFVRFMVKNAMNLKYLQEHFGHISLDMTSWYDMDDIELTREIIDCYSELTKDKLDEIVNSPYIAGKGGEFVKHSRGKVFQGVVSKTKDQIIKAMADTVTLRSTGVSWCLGDTEHGECSGVHGCMIDPSNVNNCSQAIVTSEFLPVWQEIKDRNQDLLERNDLSSDQKLAINNFLKSVVTPVINGLTSIRE